MATTITCPACAGTFHLAENLRGQKMFCPKCGAALVVTSGGVAKRNEIGKQPAQAPPSSALGFLALPLAFLLLLLLAGGASLFFLERDSEKQVAHTGPSPTEKERPQTTHDQPAPQPTHQQDKHATRPNPTAKEEAPVPVERPPLPKPPEPPPEPTVLPPPETKPIGTNVATLTGHTDFVYCVAFSPDGKTLASASRDNTVILWDVASRKSIATLTGHGGGVVASVAFSPDGKTLASGGDGIRLWDVAAAKQIAILSDDPRPVMSLAFSPDGKTLASSFLGTIKLWDVASRRNTRTLLFPQAKNDPNAIGISVWSLAFSPDGRSLASGILWQPGGVQTGGEAALWEVASGKVTATMPGSGVNGVQSVAFSADGKTLVLAGNIGGNNGSPEIVKLWDIASGKNTFTNLTSPSGYVSAVAFSPNGKLLATGIDLWDVASAKVIATLNGHTSTVWSLAFSPDSKLLASGSYDKTIKLWDISGGK